MDSCSFFLGQLIQGRHENLRILSARNQISLVEDDGRDRMDAHTLIQAELDAKRLRYLRQAAPCGAALIDFSHFREAGAGL